VSRGQAQLFGLLWGVKQSFRSYVSRSPGSRVFLDAAAGVSATGEYYFPPDPESRDTFDPATGHGVLHFRGQVHFVAHHGFLSVRLTDPRVSFRGADAELSFTTGDGADDVILARLRPATPRHEGSALTWPQIAACVHEDGVETFGGTYAVGHPLDAVRIRIPSRGIETRLGSR